MYPSEPATTADWERIDGDPVHGDPHSLAGLASGCHRQSAGDKIYMVNDGGADGGADGPRPG
jgi:hypothetical protein